MTPTKEEISQKINNISESANEYEDIGILLISRCRKLHTKLNKEPSMFSKIILPLITKENPDAHQIYLEKKLWDIKFEIDKLEVILHDHRDGKQSAHRRLSSQFSLQMTYFILILCIMMYSVMFVILDSDSPIKVNENLNVYLKYFLISVMGGLLYFLTNSVSVFSKSIMRLLVAMLIPVLFLGIVFKTGSNQSHTLDLTSTNVMLFLFGYSSNLITIILNKAISKIEEVFNVN
ncbi:hypothetical protein [Paenibacillus wynnii]|uniref:Uncharacterized protein n=1 Tax=Paenibacillus wynnii TaxID=268407 RepID=A0A098M4S2_9BACL|nr:hypothetical protein [Paenibacillus wynnii]KGE17550.1 hypothetical protein PWYN_23405 [Paenibacillus wynnii]